MRFLAPALVLLALVLPAAPADDLVLEDFEAELSGRWATGGGSIERSSDAARTGAAGGSWTAQAGGRVARREVPDDWRTFRSVRLAMRPHAEPSGPAERAFQLVARDGSGRHAWARRIRLPAGAWSDVEVRLWEFRQVGSPRWTSIASFEVFAIEAGTVDLDDVKIVRGDRGVESHVLPDDVALAVAFPDRPWTRVARRRGPFRVLTDCRAADLESLLASIEEVYGDFRTVFGIEEPAPDAPFDLFLYDAEDRYRRLFPLAIETHHSAILSRPESDGISLFYSAASSHDPRFPGGRPVLFHEATHTFLAYHLRVPSEGGWLQEGAATLLQNRHVRQADLDAQVRRMLEEGNHVPLERLFETERLRPGALYLQSMTFLEFLIEGPGRERFGRFVEGWRGGAPTDRLAREILGLAGPALDAAWLEFTRERYREE